MIETTKKLFAATLGAIAMMLVIAQANAGTTDTANAANATNAGDPQMMAAIHKLETDWAQIKFTMVPGKKQIELMDALGNRRTRWRPSTPTSPTR